MPNALTTTDRPLHHSPPYPTLSALWSQIEPLHELEGEEASLAGCGRCPNVDLPHPSCS